MSRNKVLTNVQTFTEVSGNRRLNNRAIRLGHQATHTRQLTNLGGGTTSTRIGIHKHGVEGVLLLFFTIAVGHSFFTDAFHHGLGYQVIGARPDINHLVVLLTLGYQTGGVLGLDLFNVCFSARNDIVLFVRDSEIIHTNGRTRLGGVFVTHVHQLISEDNSRFQANDTVAVVDNLRDGFLNHRTVNLLERHTFRNDFPQQNTTYSSILDAGHFSNFAVFTDDFLIDANFNLGLQVELLGVISA